MAGSRMTRNKRTIKGKKQSFPNMGIPTEVSKGGEGALFICPAHLFVIGLYFEEGPGGCLSGFPVYLSSALEGL